MISRSSLLLCCCISAKHSKNTRYISSYFGMAIVSPVFLYSGSKSPFSMLFCSIFADSPNLLLFFMIHYVDYLCKKIHICKKNGVPNWVLHSCRARPFSGAAGGIRTHVGLLPNWFRVISPLWLLVEIKRRWKYTTEAQKLRYTADFGFRFSFLFEPTGLSEFFPFLPRIMTGG